MITPKRTEVTNLLVPVCNSASHVVYGSIRVEPTFVQIGQVCLAAGSRAGDLFLPPVVSRLVLDVHVVIVRVHVSFPRCV